MTSFDSKRAKCAIIYRSELDFISRCILDCKRIETGGELFGFWTRDCVPVVLFAIGPGPRANHQTTFFNQDVDYLLEVGNRLVSHYGLQHIGEWHSHHQLGLAHPSGHDAETMASSIRHRHLGRFLMALGNCNESASVVNAFEFVETHGTDYRQLPWEIKELCSPFRKEIASDPLLASVICNPRTEFASQGKLVTTSTGESTEKNGGLPYSEGYWLNDPANGILLKKIVDGLSSEADDGKCGVFLTEDKVVALSRLRNGSQETITLGMGFPQCAPTVTCDGVPTNIQIWQTTGDVVSDVLAYCSTRREGNA